MKNSHLVILKKPYLEAILSGRKTIESRLMKHNRPPFGRVGGGDKLFFKISSGPVCAVGRVKKVMQFENLTPERIDKIKHRYNGQILGSKEYWADKRTCKYAVLVQLERVKAIGPVRIDKKDWRAWVVLTEKENFGLG